MSIDHKAYLFEYRRFEEELALILYDALEQGATEPLRAFINQFRSDLTDLWTEGPLGENWEEDVEDASVQSFADLALTAYYEVAGGNQGLSYGFDALGAYLQTVPLVSEEASLLICGHLFGPTGLRLDPGRMGTGVLAPAEVQRLHELLEQTEWPPIPPPGSDLYGECIYQPQEVDDVSQSLDRLRELYGRAKGEAKGILFADFNDGGVTHL